MTKYLLVISSLFLFSIGQSFAQDFPSGQQIVNKTALANPDRGFHLECNFVITNGSPETMFNPYGSGVGQILDAGEKFEHYPDGFVAARTEELKVEEDSIRLVQLYMYLPEFRDADIIPQKGIDNIKVLFSTLRDNGYKAILRFAYRNEHTTPGYPSAERTINHIKQLAPVIRKNIDVISVVQSGFLGQWGEWNPDLGSKEKNNEAMVELLKGIPEGYGLEMRYCWRKNNLKSVLTESDFKRLGFNNDYFTGGQHPMACGGSDFSCPQDKQYTQVAEESFDAYVSGEVPHEGRTDPTWGLDFMLDINKLLPVLKLHHYVALDVTQNFYNNIEYWRTQSVYPSKLDSLNIFYDKSYFIENDQPVARSFYQFVRDHLGYRLNVNKASFTKKRKNLRYDIQLTNTGFATVHNPKTVCLVLIDSEDKIAKEVGLEVNTKEWQPWKKEKPEELLIHTISGAINVDQSGKYRIGIAILDNQPSIKDNTEYQIKFSKDNGKVSHWTNKDKTRMVNILGEIII